MSSEGGDVVTWETPELSLRGSLLNSASPWATTLEDLDALYRCSYTGAVTTRTTLLVGFKHRPSIHQHTFFDPSSHNVTLSTKTPDEEATGSLNTYGYSPIPLREYLRFVTTIDKSIQREVARGSAASQNALNARQNEPRKPIIISVTGTAEEVGECYRLVSEHAMTVKIPMGMEVNLSCPNIPNQPPPAYSASALARYLAVLKKQSSIALRQLQDVRRPGSSGGGGEGAEASEPVAIAVGIKTPPYTYADQFTTLIDGLLATISDGSPCPISFITATNTLGHSLIYSGSCLPALKSADGLGVGGLAGDPLHPLALGNVCTLRKRLSAHPQLAPIRIIGVGGVKDNDGYLRMIAAGAEAVGVATALGRRGVGVFEEISNGL